LLVSCGRRGSSADANLLCRSFLAIFDRQIILSIIRERQKVIHNALTKGVFGVIL
jgi:hypothetical protein